MHYVLTPSQLLQLFLCSWRLAYLQHYRWVVH